VDQSREGPQREQQHGRHAVQLEADRRLHVLKRGPSGLSSAQAQKLTANPAVATASVRNA
jgi:hypothetical protein